MKQKRRQQLSGKKLSLSKLRPYDPLEVESGKFDSSHARNSQAVSWSVILHLAFQSIGVVYGDIGTSPLYVYSGIFSNGKIKHHEDIHGALALILHTLTLVPLVKYVLIVLRANDNGEGGTFALYSLICRHAQVGLIPNQQAEDSNVSNFQQETPSRRETRASNIKTKLENSKHAKYFLLFITMLGTAMVIGDGVLTPCISVLSAINGIKPKSPAMTKGRVALISAGILVILFMVQRFGTDKVGYTFAPIISVWFVSIGGIGLYNFFKYDPSILKSLYPKYIVDYFRRNQKEAWVSLGGVVLAITGTEALFADVGHFTVRSIQISMCTVTYPALLLAYTGQAAFLTKYPDLVSTTFYNSIPGHLYWPMFVIAVLASIIASQAMISATFSIIQQSLALGCFPRVKVIHTSTKYEGQVYIPEVNYLLMLACVGVTLAFRDAGKIGNAYGIAVVFVMTLTSAFLVLVMLMIWKTSIYFVIAYALVIGGVELLYLSSVLFKFVDGGYLPLAIAAVLMITMYVWNDVYRRKYHYELTQKISPDELKEIANGTNFSRLPGLAMFHSELVQGIPAIFKHYVDNIPALHSVLVFISIKSLPIRKVPQEERFIFCRVEPRELNVFRCIVRYGYTDVCTENGPFETILVLKLKEFIRDDFLKHSALAGVAEESKSIQIAEEKRQEVERDMELIGKASLAGVVHMLGESEVVAGEGAGIGKRILIDYAYNFMKRNLRGADKVFDIPHKRMLKVGMTYEL